MIDTRTANALFPDVNVSERALDAVGEFAGNTVAVSQLGSFRLGHILSRMFPKVVKREIGWFKKRQGGLWVHGRAALSKKELSFAPSAVDAAFTKGKLRWSVPLYEIVKVTLRRGLVADIIDVQLQSGRLSIRCFRAKAFATEIEQARAAVQSLMKAEA